MSRAGQFNTPAQILPKHLKWQQDVVVPEDFSADAIVKLKKRQLLPNHLISQVRLCTAISHVSVRVCARF